MFLVKDISRSALADLEASEMALAIFPGSFANPSCIAARELSKVLHEEEPILAPFSTTVDSNVLGHFYFESYRCFPFSVQMFASSDRHLCRRQEF